MYNGKRLLYIRQSPHIGSFAFGIRSVIVGRPRRSYEPCNPLPAKIINQGQNHISASFIDQRMLKWWAPSYLPPCKKQMDAGGCRGLQTQLYSSHNCSCYARCGIFTTADYQGLEYMICGHWLGTYVLFHLSKKRGSNTTFKMDIRLHL